MSIFASLLRGAYKAVGAKKAFGLPEEEIRKVIEKQNRNRGVFTPTDHKAHYETITVNGFPCLIVRENKKPSERAILYFFGVVPGHLAGRDGDDVPRLRQGSAQGIVVGRDAQRQRAAGGKAAGADISAAVKPDHSAVARIDHVVGLRDAVLRT